MGNKFFRLIGRKIPKQVKRNILLKTRRPPVNRCDFGQLRRLQPISSVWGFDRGKPIDRHYVETFLSRFADDIQGRVLEVGDNTYTLTYGGQRVTRSEVVHASPGNPVANYVADFTDAPQLPTNSFDCVICTQTLQLIPDLNAAVSTIYRILKPGGVLLATLPGITKVYSDPDENWLDYWRFTPNSARWLFGRQFPPQMVQIQAFGNVLTSIAFLHGLAAEEMTSDELEYYDDRYPMLVAVRTQKPDVKP